MNYEIFKTCLQKTILLSVYTSFPCWSYYSFPIDLFLTKTSGFRALTTKSARPLRPDGLFVN